jgi:thiol:disulfide interchange protein
MRRLLSLVVLFALMFTACSSPTAPSGPPAQPTSTPTEISPTATLAVLLKDYVASDPSLVATTGRPQFIEFFAFWCTVCQGMRPTIHQIQDKYGAMVDFIYLDIDAANTKTLQQKLVFTGLRPTIIFTDSEGKEVSRLFGEQKQETLEQHIMDLLATG